MHALVLLCINQHMKFEVPSFTKTENGSCDHNHAPFRGGLPSIDQHLIPAYKIWQP